MVVIRIVTQKNGETVYFDMSIPQVHYIKLISCSLYNSWNNLKNKGSLSIVESDGSVKVSKIPPGHYALETLAKQMEESLALMHIRLLASLLLQIMERSR